MGVFVTLIVIFVALAIHNWVYKRFFDQKLSLSIAFSRKTAFEGDELSLVEELSNAKLLPLPWVAVKFQLSRNLLFLDGNNAKISDDYYRNDLFCILMYQKITRTLPFICSKRGYYTIKSADLVTSNILITSKLAVHVPCNTSLTVYPAHINNLDVDILSKQVMGSVLSKRFINPDPFEFKGIREYVPTDSLKWVNFKATAKTGDLMVNIMDYTVSKEIVIILNLQKYSAWSNDWLFEQSIRLTATYASLFIDNGITVSFYSNGRDIVLGSEFALEGGQGQGHLTNIYESLARIDLAKEPTSITDMLYEKLDLSNEDQVFLLISTYHEKDLSDAFDDIQNRGHDAFWIVPTLLDTVVKMDFDETKIKWSVSFDDKK